MITGQHISLIFAGIFLVIAVFGLLKGLSRGAGRQTVRAVTIAVSIIISLMITGAITDYIASLCEGKTLDEVLMMFDLHTQLEQNVLDLLACFDAVTVERIIDLPLLTVIMPFIFTGCFIAISGLLLIVHGIISIIFRLSGKRAGILSRLIGMIIGAVQGVAVAVVFLLPIVNLVNLTDLAQVTVKETQPENSEANVICQVYDDYIAETRESVTFKFVESMGANALCDEFATIEVDGAEENLRSTLSLVLSSADDFMEILNYDLVNPTAEQCENMKETIDKLVYDPYISSILSGATKGLATAIDSGIIVIELEEPALGVMNNLMKIFTTLNTENFPRDIDTIIDVYILLAREGVLLSLAGTTEEITDAFIAQDENGVTVIRRIINTIQDNPHMKPLVTMLTKLSVSIMMNDVGVEQGEEVYDTIKDGITNVIAIDKTQYDSNEDYINAVSESLDKTLKDHEIELAPEIVDSMAQYITEQDYSNLTHEEVTDDEVNDAILSYYEAYMNYINNGGENPFPGLEIPGADGESDSSSSDTTDGVGDNLDNTSSGDKIDDSQLN